MTGRGKKAKGKRRQQELADILTLAGFPARSAEPPEPDVVCPYLHPMHIECKGAENFQYNSYLDQSIKDANKRDLIACVIHKKKNRPWTITLPLDFFLVIFRRKNEETQHGQS